jgi:hypothetical protein
MARYWFRPKRYGFGATPATWEGWALGGVYLVVIIAASAMFLPSGGEPASTWDWLGWAAIIALATAVTVIVSFYKTEGRWRWRWGTPKKLAE